MNKVLMINLPVAGSFEGFVGGTHFPLGIGYIASVLKKAGYDVKIIDMNLYFCLNKADAGYIYRIIKEENYDILALGGVFLHFECLREYSGISKRIYPDKIVIAGGTMVSAIPDIVIKNTDVDVVVIGEGEATIIELLQALKEKKELKDIDGIAYKSNGNIIKTGPRKLIQDLDEISFPARELFSYKRVFRKYFTFGVPARYCGRLITSRGCPFTCTFCNSIFGKKPRIRSVDNIISEIEHLRSKYNVQYIRFVDEIFFGGRKDLIAEFCKKIIKERIRFFWYCMPNQNTVDASTIRLMKKAGCIGIGFGTESVSQTILKEFKKNNNLDKLKEDLQACHHNEIDVIISLLGGSFSETKETLDETKNFIKSVNRIRFIMPAEISSINVIPGTELYEQAKIRGFIKDELDYIMNLKKYTRWDFSINLTSMPKGEFQNLISNINREIKEDYYKKHPFIRIIRMFNLDHINWRHAFRNFSIKQVIPFSQALSWSIFSKRKNFFSKAIQLLIYHDYMRTKRNEKI